MARTVTTESGFVCTIEEDALDDFELLEALGEMDNKEDGLRLIAGFKDTMKLLLGEEQKDKLFDHIRAEHGRVKVSVLKTEIMQIFAGLSEAKKN